MPKTVQPQDDQDLDPLEHADQEDLQDQEEEAPLVDTDVHPAMADPDAELVEEIEKVAVEEETPAKQKTNGMIPRHLVDADLTWKDLLDEGEI